MCELSCTGTFEVTFSCSIVLSDNFKIGLLINVDVRALIFHLKTTLLWPNLGLIGGISLEAAIDFITCFSGNMFGSKHLSTPCTSGKFMPLDLACDLVWTKYFPTFSLPIS